jgi:phosphoribosyl-AMP cyclohydrolase
MIKPNFDKTGGLIPAIVQDAETGEVLMLAFMNQQAWEATLNTGRATYWSRSRQELWVKGRTSGHLQIVKEIRIDCDEDTVLLKVEQLGGAACHTGHRSCFHKLIENGSVRIVGKPVFDPKEVYGK